MSAPLGVKAAMPLFRGANNSISLRLAAGDKQDEFRTEITVIVSDGIGERQEAKIYPVTVS